MLPRKALAVSLPVALAGAWLAFDASRRVERLQGELAGLEAAGHAEGARFVETLQGAHAERLLQLLDQRRTIAIELNAARRDRFIGLFAVAAAVLVLAGAFLLGRIAEEIEEERRFIHGEGPPPR